MKLLTRNAVRSVSIAICLTALPTTASLAQQPQKPQTSDVLRINTELVQSAVTVVNQDGRFVDGLTRDQFELIVDGQPRPINFFEEVTSGSPREQQLAAQDKAADPDPKLTSAAVVPGRRILFFIDDLHLSPDSMNGTRQMLKRFIDDEMSSKDTVAIISPAARSASCSNLLITGGCSTRRVQLSVDHRFARSSHLNYWVFVYNAKRDGAGNPDLTVKSEIRRDGRLIAAAPTRTIRNGSPDPDRIPFGDQLSLGSFSSGRYELLVTIVDAIAGTSVQQSIDFEVC